MNIKTTGKKQFAAFALFLVFGASTVSAKPSSFGTSSEDLKTKEVRSKATEKLDLKDIGPSNVGGRVRGLLWDNTDQNYQTLYAGGVAGGLFISTNGGSAWSPVGGSVKDIPVSCIFQDKAGNIYVGTGEGFMNPNNTNAINNDIVDGFLGKGMFRKKVGESEFKLLTATKPVSLTPTDNWAYINRITFNETNNTLYAATNRGVWYSTNGGDSWTATSITGKVVQDIKITTDGTIYFSEKTNKFYGVVAKKATQQDLSAAEVIFPKTNVNAAPTRIEIAVSPLNTNYVYLAVAGMSNKHNDSTNNTLDAVFYSKDKGVSTTLISSSDLQEAAVSLNGVYSNTIAVYPNDVDRILVGGTLFVVAYDGDKAEDGEFSWTSPTSLAQPTYSSNYLHENIHAFVFHPNPKTAADSNQFYVASDGGISLSKQQLTGEMPYFEIKNYGLKITQFYSVAPSNDGSVVGGAQGNRVTYIGRGIGVDSNQRADIMKWSYAVDETNGGNVATSLFHRVAPDLRKPIFVSVANSNYARVYAKYNDATDDQTWDFGLSFITGEVGSDKPNSLWPSSLEVTPSALWETTTNTHIKDSVMCSLNAGKTSIKRGNQTILLQKGTLILTGDTVMVRAENYFDYPFLYEFKSDLEFQNDTSFKIQSSLQSRFFVVMEKDNINGVFMTDQAVDYSPLSLRWYELRRFAGNANVAIKIQSIAVSKDGNHLFIAANKASSDTGTIVRVSNLLDLNPSLAGTGSYPITSTEIFKTGRPISSISVDPNNNDNLLVTCGNINATAGNIYYSSNALDASPVFTDVLSSVTEGDMTRKDPIFSSLIEMSNGSRAFVGTSHGVYMTEDLTGGNPSWKLVTGTDFQLPIYMIKQQQRNNPDITVSYPANDGTMTKYSWQGTYQPGAIYVATYGRGLFVDTTFVVERAKPIVGIEGKKLAPKYAKLSIYPNPVKETANIQYTTVKASKVQLNIFNVAGRLVYSSALGTKTAGNYAEKVNTQQFTKGVFIVQVIVDDQIMTSKMIVD